MEKLYPSTQAVAPLMFSKQKRNVATYGRGISIGKFGRTKKYPSLKKKFQCRERNIPIFNPV